MSKTNTAPVIREIPLESILPNSDNFYQLRNLDALADSIALSGLQQPLVVTPSPDKPGKFTLISGHRRRAAIEKLVKDKANPREDLRIVPCVVQTYRSPAMAELQLIMANATTRVLTNAEISRQAERVELLLYQLKEEGQEFPGRMRDQVAKACKVSAPKLARLKVIREKLKAKELVYLFEKDKLSEQAAYALARLPEDFQERIARVMGAKAENIGGGKAENILKLYGEGWRWEPDLQCPDGKACRRGDAFLRHDVEHPYNMCGGEKCCLTCSRAKDSYGPCDRMCSKAQAARKEKRDEAKAQADARAREAAKGYQATTKERAQRLLRAIDAAGLPDDSKFAWRYYWKPIRVSDLRRWAAGQFNEEEDLWTCAELDPERIESPVSLAQLFGCTTDYLLGLSDELTAGAALENPTSEGEAPVEPADPPVEEASADPEEDSPDDVAAPDRAVLESPQLGNPPAEGWIPLAWLDGRQRPVKDKQLAAVKYSADGIYMLDVARWFMGPQEWRYPGGIEIGDVEILGWFPLPED